MKNYFTPKGVWFCLVFFFPDINVGAINMLPLLDKEKISCM